LRTSIRDAGASDFATARFATARLGRRFVAATSAILQPDVGVQAVHAALTAKAGLLVAAER
jgi:hypothetical protein